MVIQERRKKGGNKGAGLKKSGGGIPLGPQNPKQFPNQSNFSPAPQQLISQPKQAPVDPLVKMQQ